MSSLGAFIGNLIGSVAPSVIPLFAHGFKGVGQAFRSMSDATTGAHLTGAQNEANAFTAQMLTNQQNFEERMSNTAYQRQVSDMQNAGVNPALMYGNGASGASTPSSASPQSVSPNSPDIVGLMGQMANLALLDAQRRKINSEIKTNEQGVEESRQREDYYRQLAARTNKEIGQVEANVRKLNLEGDAQEIANRFIEQEKELAIEIDKMTIEDIKKNIEVKDKNLEKMDYEIKIAIRDLANKEQEFRNLLAVENMTKAQTNQLYELAKNIKEERVSIMNKAKLTEKELNWYTHDKIVGDIKTAGQVVGSFFGIGKIGNIAKSVFGKKQSAPADLTKKQSAPVDLTGYGAYGSYE